MTSEAGHSVTERQPVFQITGLSKSFGSFEALHQIGFEVHAGEVLGIAGRSGSGKSVIAELLAGSYAPDAGIARFRGRDCSWPLRARALGIEVVLQRPALVDTADVTANVFLGRELTWPALGRWYVISPRGLMDRQTVQILGRLGLRLDNLRQEVANLSGEHRQLLGIARALVHPARLIVVDDPTALLSRSYQERLLSLIQTWRQDGLAVIYCGSDLDHLFAVTDRILVLHKGTVTGSYRTDQTNREEIVTAMVGTPGTLQNTPIIWALDSYRLARERSDRMRLTQEVLEQDLATLDAENVQLIKQLDAQVNALDAANQALQDAQRRLLQEREAERKHLARELHDQEIQDLLSICYQLEELETMDGLDRRAKAELGAVRDDLRLLVEDLRNICRDLRPPTIDSLGIGAAIVSFADEWERRAGVHVSLDLDPHLGRLPEGIELSVFRIVQEALNNVRKHSQATAVTIALKHTSARTLRITISDNGQGLAEGLDLASLGATGHYGLLGISERVALLGGRLSLRNQTNGGLRIRVEVPHPRVAFRSTTLLSPTGLICG